MKKALVLAASEGLGYGCAVALANAGYIPTLVSRSLGKLEKASAAISNSSFLQADLTDDNDIKFLCDHIRTGQYDALVLNSGGPNPGKYAEMGASRLLSATQELVAPTLKVLDAALPFMRHQKFGRIVNISSIGVVKPIIGLAASNSSRGLLTNLLAGVAQEEAPFGITLNQILPGIIWTPRQERLTKHDAEIFGITNEEALNRKIGLIPAGRMGEVESVGELAAFLCSDVAGYITGQSIAVDGGLLGVTR